MFSTRWFVATTVLLGLQLSANAQTVTGTAAVDVSKPADAMRMQIDLAGRGPDATAALADLAQRKKAALARVATVKGPKPTVRIGEAFEQVIQPATPTASLSEPPTVFPKDDSNDPPLPPPPPLPRSVTVIATLQASWPMPAASETEARIIFVRQMQDGVRAADLSGREDLKAAGGCACGAAEPVFQFVRHVSEAEQSQTLADAVASARRTAAGLAKASGSDLGSLQTLQGTVTAESLNGTTVEVNLTASEIISGKPGSVAYRVTATASFALDARVVTRTARASK